MFLNDKDSIILWMNDERVRQDIFAGICVLLNPPIGAPTPDAIMSFQEEVIRRRKHVTTV